MLLAGDIGGTNTRLALYSDDAMRVVREDSLPSRSFGALEDAVRAFLGPRPPRVAAATFGIAGPVIGGRVKTTNLPWLVDEQVLSKRLAIPCVRLLNDLVTIAFGAVAAPKSALVRLQGGPPRRDKGATLAVIAAGTGLGEAALLWDGERHVPCGSEGSHGDFAPRNRLEWELFEFLAKRVKGRVSYERIVSGPGLGNVYDFFRDAKRMREPADVARAIDQAPDRNRAIAELGLQGKSRACKAALKVFTGVYGAESGNLALRFLATGGVFLAGGISANMSRLLATGPFLKAFRDKGRLSPLVEKVPVAIVLDPNIGLWGAARHAASLREG
jgi:glucokinase